MATLLNWQRQTYYYGDPIACRAICAIGIFRMRTVGRRVILTLNDVKIGNHPDALRARAQADRLIEAVADHMERPQAGERTEPERIQDARPMTSDAYKPIEAEIAALVARGIATNQLITEIARAIAANYGVNLDEPAPQSESPQRKRYSIAREANGELVVEELPAPPQLRLEDLFGSPDGLADEQSRPTPR